MTTDQCELFGGAPKPPPIPPAPHTIKCATLTALIAGPVTQATFTESWRLAEYVRQLIADRWAIRVREVPYCGRTIAEYRLDMGDAATRSAVAAHVAGAD